MPAQPKKSPLPFSLRLTRNERDALKARAKGVPLINPTGVMLRIADLAQPYAFRFAK